MAALAMSVFVSRYSICLPCCSAAAAITEATSEAMEMSDVVFTVPSTARSTELAADTHQSTMHLPSELPPNAAGHANRRKMCINAYVDSGHGGLGHHTDHRSVISVVLEMC